VIKLQDVLPQGSVMLDLSLADKSRAISLVAKMLATASGTSPEVIEAALVAREALGSTGVGGGVALPHARLHVLRGTHAVFVRLAAPIAFESIDSKPVDLVCAVVAPDEPNAALLSAVSAVSKVLRDAQKTAALRTTQSAAVARDILLAGDS
jgi:PTS system nitrogen regulatory IIA component